MSVSVPDAATTAATDSQNRTAQAEMQTAAVPEVQETSSAEKLSTAPAQAEKTFHIDITDERGTTTTNAADTSSSSLAMPTVVLSTTSSHEAMTEAQLAALELPRLRPPQRTSVVYRLVYMNSKPAQGSSAGANAVASGSGEKLHVGTSQRPMLDWKQVGDHESRFFIGGHAPAVNSLLSASTSSSRCTSSDSVASPITDHSDYTGSPRMSPLSSNPSTQHLQPVTESGSLVMSPVSVDHHDSMASLQLCAPEPAVVQTQEALKKLTSLVTERPLLVKSASSSSLIISGRDSRSSDDMARPRRPYECQRYIPRHASTSTNGNCGLSRMGSSHFPSGEVSADSEHDATEGGRGGAASAGSPPRISRRASTSATNIVQRLLHSPLFHSNDRSKHEGGATDQEPTEAAASSSAQPQPATAAPPLTRKSSSLRERFDRFMHHHGDAKPDKDHDAHHQGEQHTILDAGHTAAMHYESDSSSASHDSLGNVSEGHKTAAATAPRPERPSDASSSSPVSAVVRREKKRAVSLSIRDRKQSLSRSSSESSLHEKYGKSKEVLGKGANATVRLAHKTDHSCPERLYAVKEFRKRRKDETEREYIKKVSSEFCISSTLHHPNVIETVDLVQDEHFNWCEIMEYMPGGDLFSRITNGTPMIDDEINCLFVQLLRGIEYLHSMGVAHRDLKPENLLLDASGRQLKITDFGTSEVFRVPWEKKGHKVKGVCGSDPYIAPEEWDENGQHEYEPDKVDVWACGVIFFVMKHSTIPWKLAAPSDPHYKHFLTNRLGRFDYIDRLPDLEQRKTINSILEPNPTTRPTVDQIMDSAWVKGVKACSHTAAAAHFHCPGISAIDG
ncbi:hypothetical protein RI367_003940 [Sorochytrium milnesiophthora]